MNSSKLKTTEQSPPINDIGLVVDFIFPVEGEITVKYFQYRFKVGSVQHFIFARLDQGQLDEKQARRAENTEHLAAAPVKVKDMIDRIGECNVEHTGWEIEFMKIPVKNMRVLPPRSNVNTDRERAKLFCGPDLGAKPCTQADHVFALKPADLRELPANYSFVFKITAFDGIPSLEQFFALVIQIFSVTPVLPPLKTAFSGK
jgi:hypothetical protein